MLARLPNNSYLCKCKDSSGVATLRKGQTDSPSLLSFVGIIHNVGSMKEQEVWKSVVGFEGYYEVSNLGRVRSMERTIVCSDGKIRKHKGVVLSMIKHNSGYMEVKLFKDGVGTGFLIHRLVAFAFIPNPDNKPELDHINTIRTDNRVENLRWVTRKENCGNNITHKRVLDRANSSVVIAKTLATKAKKNSHLAPKRVYQFTLDGEFIAEYSSCHEAARKTGANFVMISTVARHGAHSKYGKTAGGYLWSYDKNPPTYLSESIKNRHRKVYQYDLN